MGITAQPFILDCITDEEIFRFSLSEKNISGHIHVNQFSGFFTIAGLAEGIRLFDVKQRGQVPEGPQAESTFVQLDFEVNDTENKNNKWEYDSDYDIFSEFESRL